MTVTVIGIAGGSGSGKSTLVQRLVESSFADRITVLPHDAYYYSVRDLPEPLASTENWDHPETIDNDLFVKHIDQLLSGQAVDRPEYDFSTHTRTQQTSILQPRPILLLEGILLFAIPEIAKRIGLRVYVDTPAEERLARRLRRDIAERGRSVDSVLAQFRGSVRPMHDLFVEPSRKLAHLVIPWDWQHDPEPPVELLLSWIATKSNPVSLHSESPNVT